MELARTDHSPDDSDHSDHSLDADGVHHSDDATTIALGGPGIGPGGNGMATMVAQTATAGGQAQKRYRPAPAKTFQCRGYGECRMVFSRSEHLARHIRKHTGERPFSCHCGKQFSRLDNLRQHAQTVHADKQDQNEQMMRDLTTLHATMAAANKGGGRTGTSAGRRAAAAATTTPNATTNAGHQVGGNATKQEDMGLGLGLSLRPGTSTGYEGDMWASTSPSATAGGNHSFRDSREASQSFLASQHHGSFRAFGADSHRPFTSSAGYPASSHPPNGGISNGGGRPSTATAPPPPLSRPTTSSGPPDPSRTLPPLSAVVSASLAPSPPPALGGHPHHPFVHHGPPNGSSSGYAGGNGGLPFPFRRPTTGTRPGTAPAFFAKSSSTASPYTAGGFGGLAATREREREFLSSRDGLGSRHGGGQHDREAGGGGGWEYEQGQHDSPFYFNAPSVADNQPGVTSTGTSSTPGSSACPSTSTSTGTASSHGVPTPTATPTAATSPRDGSSVNPRKRGFGGPDGPAYDDDSVHAHREPPRSSHGLYGGAAGLSEREPPRSSHGGYGGRSTREYEYGSESRPASRRISVMELCNETDAEPPRSSHGLLRPQSSGTFAFNVPPSSSVGPPSTATFAFQPPTTAPGAFATTGPGTPGVLSPSTSSSSAASIAAGGGRPASAYAAFGLSSRTPSSSTTRSFRRSPSSSTSPSGFLYASRPTTSTATATGRRSFRERYGSTASPESRPTTSSGLVASAATLHIFDRGSPIAVDAYEREREQREPREQPYERFVGSRGGYEQREPERKYVEYGRRGYEQRQSADSPSSRLSPYPEQYDGDSGRGSRSPASSASAATPIFAFSAPAPSAPVPPAPVALSAPSSATSTVGAYQREGRYREEAASQRFCESPELEEGVRGAGGRVFERDAGYARRRYDEREYAEYEYEQRARPRSSRAGYERGYEQRRAYGSWNERDERGYRGGGERGEFYDDDGRDERDGPGRGWSRRGGRSASPPRDDGEEEFGADERERVSPPASASRSSTAGRSAAAAVRGDVSAERDGRVLQRYGPDFIAAKSASAATAVDDPHRERVFGYGGVLPGRDGPAAARGRAEADEGAHGDARTDRGDEEAARDEADARADGNGDAAPAPAASTATAPATVSSSSATAGNALPPPAFASSAPAAASRTSSSSSAAAFASSAAPGTAHALTGGSRVRAGPEFDADGAAGVSRGVLPTADGKREREPGWEYRERERYGYERDGVGGKYEYGRGEQRERGWDVSDEEDEDGDVEMSDVEVKQEVDELEMDV